MSNSEESRIRELFQSLKKEDELFAPSFRRTLEGRPSRTLTVSMSSFRFRIALSLAAVIALAVPLYFYFSEAPVGTSVELAEEILQWESPTDFLLTYSDEPLLMTAPSIEIEVPYWVEEGVIQRLELKSEADDS